MWVLKRLGKSQARGYRLLGLLGGMLPDLDFIPYALARGRLEMGEDYNHHTWISHALPVYWLAGAAGWLWGRKRGDERLQTASLVLAAAATAHLLQDTIGTVDGIMFAWPFSRRMIVFHSIGTHGRAWVRQYTRDPVFALEWLLVGLAVVVERQEENYSPAHTSNHAASASSNFKVFA
jgi:hypothetical protein